jgi:hypothetical protein
MIQGCWYLRRSTDRWLLSKNSTTQLEGLKGWHGAGLLWNCSIPITNTKGLYLYPCPNMTPSRPWVQHLLLKLMPRRQCPSRTRHQFVLSLYSGHVIMYSRTLPFPSAKQPFCRMMARYRPQASLPNALRKISCRMVFLYQTRPISQSLSCTNFWCSQRCIIEPHMGTTAAHMPHRQPSWFGHTGLGVLEQNLRQVEGVQILQFESCWICVTIKVYFTGKRKNWRLERNTFIALDLKGSWCRLEGGWIGDSWKITT